MLKTSKLILNPNACCATAPKCDTVAVKPSVNHPPTVGETKPKAKPNDDINANAAPARSAVIPSSFIGIQYIAGIQKPFPNPKAANPIAESHIEAVEPNTATKTPTSFNICP